MSDAGSDVAALCSRLRRLPTAVVSDVLTAMGAVDRVVSWTLRPLAPPDPFAGPAVCFSGADGPDPAARAGSRLVYETDRKITSGCVAVIATGGHHVGAVIGGNSIGSWRRRGCAALVTDGLIRDSADFDGLPTYATGVTPMNNVGRWSYRSLDRAVSLPGQTGRDVVLEPGDVVHGDRDGVVVVPAAILGRLVADAERTDAIERTMRAQIEAGLDRERVYDGNDRFGHVHRIADGFSRR